MMATSEAPPFLLTPIDNITPRRYSSKMLFFPESPGSDVYTVVNTLRDGLAKTLEAISPLSGTVKTFGEKGAVCVTAPWSTVDDIFHVKDLRYDGELEYRNLRDRHFPLENLDPNILMPSAAMPLGVPFKGEKPVMLVQTNIIKGGMIMALCMHHSFTDGNGTTAIASVWAAYCRGDDGQRLITQEMVDRGRLMRGCESASLADVPEFTMRPIEEEASSSGVLFHIRTLVSDRLMVPLCRWSTSTQKSESNALPGRSQFESAIFFFPKKSLIELKIMAYAGDRSEDGESWISTNDALCALLGCCVHSARREELRTMADRSCIVQIVVGGRRRLDPPLPAEYIGNIVSCIRVFIPSRSIDSTPAKISEIAHLIRDQIEQCDARYFRKMIAALSSVRDLARVIPTPPSQFEDALYFSSWANQSFYEINWGDAVGARIERVRNPADFPNFCFIMPELKGAGFKGDDCGLEIQIRLEKGQMRRLKQNELFMRFAQWRSN